MRVLWLLGLWSTRTSVHFAGDRVSDVAQLLLLLFEVLGRGGGAVLIHPVLGFFDGFEELCGLLVRSSSDTRWGLKAYRFLLILLDLATKSLVVIDLVL